MKKGLFLIFILTLIYIPNVLGLIYILNIFETKTASVIDTAGIIDTRATTASTSINITVDANPPDIIIDSPINDTYIKISETDLNFTVTDSLSNVDTTWYNLDGGSNITITGNITFNITRGSHTLFLFANDTGNLENGSESIAFSLGPITTSNEANGSSTNFSDFRADELEVIDNLTLEAADLGIISFLQTINISEDTNIDEFVDISHNSIVVDSDALPIFNKSATLELKSLSFTNPRILRNGGICSSSICTKISYSYTEGILKFNVTGFTNYSSEETPSETPGVVTVSGGGGGEGGGGGAGRTPQVTVYDFSVLDNTIKAKVEQGKVKEYFLEVLNTGTAKITVNLNLDPALDFIFIENSLSGYDVDIEPGQTKVVRVTFAPEDDLKPDVYATKLIAQARGIQKTFPVIAEVVSKGPTLFDVSLEILADYQKVFPGGKVIAEVSLFNLGAVSRVDVNIEYSIKDLKGNVIATDKEVTAVETQLTKTKEMRIPDYLATSDYVFAVKVEYAGRISTSSAIFNVAEEPEIRLPLPVLPTYLIILVIAILIIITMIIFYQRKMIDLMKTFTSRPKKIEDRIKLRRQLDLLNQAYNRGLIKEEEFNKATQLISSLIRDTKKKELKEKDLDLIKKLAVKSVEPEEKKHKFNLFKKKEKKRQELIDLIKEAKKRVR